MTRDYEHDEWMPWYLEDTVGWLELSLAARGAAAEVARKMGRRSGGSIALPRGLASLAVLLRLRWTEELEPAMSELIETGRLTWVDGVLHDPGWAARQRRGSTERMRNKRARDKPGVTPVTSLPSHPVTVTGVTSPSASASGSGSDLEIASGVLDRLEPLAVDAEQAFDAIDMNRPVGQPAAIVWVAFCGHYAGQHFGSRQSLLGKWQKWVSQQAVYSARDRENERKREDQAAERKRFAREGPERPPPPTPEQAKRFAEGLSARILGNRKAAT